MENEWTNWKKDKKYNKLMNQYKVAIDDFNDWSDTVEWDYWDAYDVEKSIKRLVVRDHYWKYDFVPKEFNKDWLLQTWVIYMDREIETTNIHFTVLAEKFKELDLDLNKRKIFIDRINNREDMLQKGNKNYDYITKVELTYIDWFYLWAYPWKLIAEWLWFSHHDYKQLTFNIGALLQLDHKQIESVIDHEMIHLLDWMIVPWDKWAVEDMFSNSNTLLVDVFQNMISHLKDERNMDFFTFLTEENFIDWWFWWHPHGSTQECFCSTLNCFLQMSKDSTESMDEKWQRIFPEWTLEQKEQLKWEINNFLDLIHQESVKATKFVDPRRRAALEKIIEIAQYWKKQIKKRK